MTFVPAEAFHPAEVVEDEMRARGWSRDELARRMCRIVTPYDFGVMRLALDLYLEIRTPDAILGDMAEDFARAFGIDADVWVRLDHAWRSHPSTQKASAGPSPKTPTL